MANYQHQKIRTGHAKRTGEDDLRAAVRLFIVFLVLCAAIAGGIVLLFHLQKDAAANGNNGYLTVREISVKGNTRYQEDAIV